MSSDALKSDGTTVVWLRDDLRTADNPALRAATERDGKIVVVYVLDDVSDAGRHLGSASLWWLHHSLTALASELSSKGATLVLRRGDAAKEIKKLVGEVDAANLFWNRRYAESERAQDDSIGHWAAEHHIHTENFAASLLFEPGTILNGEGNTFSVFSAFWRATKQTAAPRKPVPEPSTINGESGVQSDDLDDWGLLPTSPDWSTGFSEQWQPGTKGAHERLKHFVADRLEDYPKERDRPGASSTSELSPYLKFGEISPYQIWHEVLENGHASGAAADKYLTEVGWREFNYSLLASHPKLATVNFDDRFDNFPWNRPTKKVLDAWKFGRTGFPLVDAAMRQLWQTGWMHNRTRMVVASFLIKNLRIDWRIGEQWFWDCLVDADPANNTANWQWVAGSGADAAPYFRVFNPVLQSKKFDTSGDYIRRWVPELAHLDDKQIHEPWTASADLVAQASGTAPDAYPDPIVDLRESRNAALDAYDQVKR